MSKVKPSIPRGTRDFGPVEVYKRKYIFDTIRKVFEKYGFEPIETPTMENLSTLTGKYGEEGDTLLFKILNSGDYLSKADKMTQESGDSGKHSFSISEKGLRYDLTIPFARYVVMHQNDIMFPFKRYQIQPVWRADRPQKGRYREFYQCDVDIIGSTSLMNEVELIQIYDEVFSRLKVPGITLKLNNRKILAGIAEVAGIIDQLVPFTVAIDKLDKIGMEGVKEELKKREIPVKALKALEDTAGKNNDEKLKYLTKHLKNSTVGMKGIAEMENVLGCLKEVQLQGSQIVLDITLARGLNYYTGTIYEVTTSSVEMGSIGGGGRYDDLTGMFGLPNVSGVGISFGAERIYDVMEELHLFPESRTGGSKAIFINFGGESEKAAFKFLQAVRHANVSAELYPSSDKIGKQMKYADHKRISYAIFVGDEELAVNKMKARNLITGEENLLTIEQLITLLTHK
jgi:histidyl-tRNA synthetase